MWQLNSDLKPHKFTLGKNFFSNAFYHFGKSFIHMRRRIFKNGPPALSLNGFLVILPISFERKYIHPARQILENTEPTLSTRSISLTKEYKHFTCVAKNTVASTTPTSKHSIIKILMRLSRDLLMYSNTYEIQWKITITIKSFRWNDFFLQLP